MRWLQTSVMNETVWSVALTELGLGKQPRVCVEGGRAEPPRSGNR